VIRFGHTDRRGKGRSTKSTSWIPARCASPGMALGGPAM